MSRVISKETRVQNVLYLLLQMEEGIRFSLFKKETRLDKKDSTKTKGICNMFEYLLQGSFVSDFSALERRYTKSQMNYYLIEACKELGVYSGSKGYPISAEEYGDYGIAPERKALYAYTNKHLWSYFTTYGRRRRRVLKKMIELIRNDLNTQFTNTHTF